MVVPKQEAIQKLVDLGFTKTASTKALIDCHNDMHSALHFLRFPPKKECTLSDLNVVEQQRRAQRYEAASLKFKEKEQQEALARDSRRRRKREEEIWERIDRTERNASCLPTPWSLYTQ